MVLLISRSLLTRRTILFHCLQSRFPDLFTFLYDQFFSQIKFYRAMITVGGCFHRFSSISWIVVVRARTFGEGIF